MPQRSATSFLPPAPKDARTAGATHPSPETEAPRSSAAPATGEIPVVVPAGPRKLIRPPLSEIPARISRAQRRYPAASPNRPYRKAAETAAGPAHAEELYFQKQIQAHTEMAIVLDDGERIEGRIDWYDRDAIKVRTASGCVLIYKTCIKYLYKSGENGRR